MEIRIDTDTYNERRYGKPWIATVDFSESTKGNYTFGDWTGDHYNGGAGVLTIDANPGDILAKGQKDFRKPRNSAPGFYVVTPSGDLSRIGDKGEAYKHYLGSKETTPDTDALLKERAALVARIEEIDAIVNN